MFAKTMMAAVAALMVSQVAMAQDKLIDSVSVVRFVVEEPHGARERRQGLGREVVPVQRHEPERLLGGQRRFLETETVQQHPGRRKNLWDIGFTPVFRFQNDNKKGLYYEAGIGVHALSELYNNDDNRPGRPPSSSATTSASAMCSRTTGKSRPSSSTSRTAASRSPTRA